MASGIEIVASVNSGPAQRGAAEFNRALASTDPTVAKFDRALSGLTRGLIALGTALVIRGAAQFASQGVRLSDTFTALRSRLDAVTEGGAGADAIINALADSASRAHAPTLALVDIYARNAQALKQLGVSQAEGVRLTETLSKLGTIGGQGVESTTAALRQLSQAFNSGVFRGEEFNSVAEQLPGVMRILQAETGKTAGELRKLAADGKLTADLLISALLNASQSVDLQFSKVARTAEASGAVFVDTFSRVFGEISAEIGVSEAWAAAFDRLTQTLGGATFQAAAEVAALGLKATADLLVGLIDASETAGFKFAAFLEVISRTETYQTAAAGLQFFIDKLYEFGKSAVDNAAAFVGAIGSAFSTVAPESATALGKIASDAAEAEARLRAVAEWQVRVQRGEGLDTSVPPTGSRPVVFGPGTGGDSAERAVERARRLLETERLRAELLRAQIDGNEAVASAVQSQLEIHSRITDELRKANPELAGQIEQQILLNNELERAAQTHTEVQRTNTEFAERFASVVTDGFANAIKGAKSFTDALKDVAFQLLEVIAQAALLDPLKKSITQSISGGLGGFDFGSIVSGFLGGLGGLGVGFANGGVLTSPAAFTSGGIRGVAGERGPEAILPLKRGADGALGVAFNGGASDGGNTYVNINIAGDATDETVARMERVAESVFARRAPTVVRSSVAAVRREHVRDPGYLRR